MRQRGGDHFLFENRSCSGSEAGTPEPGPAKFPRMQLRPARTSFVVKGNRFDVDARYQYVRTLGVGAFGVVCAARDEVTGETVAIKKILRAFDDPTDAKRTLREIRLLATLRHDNVISLRDVMRPESPDSFDDVYLVVDLMDSDLHQIIKSPQPLSNDHCQFFLYQMLRGLKYMHSAGVIHRDLKPGNLLVNKDAILRICDFNLARTTCESGSDDDECPGMTQYVVTRWYRAPELILRGEYTKAIDVWSVGCIFAELLSRRPLFPGQNYVHQLELITKVLGTPTEEDLRSINGSERALGYLRALPLRQRVPLQQLFPKASLAAIDLLERMLVIDPKKRISAAEALAHPYLADLHDPDDEPVSPHRIRLEFEEQKCGAGALGSREIKELVYQECLRFHPDE